MASPTSLKRAHIQKMSRCRIKMKIRFLSDQSDSCQLSNFITCDLRSLILIQVSRLKIKLCNKNQLFFHFSIWISIGVSGFWAMGVWVGFQPNADSPKPRDGNPNGKMKKKFRLGWLVWCAKLLEYVRWLFSDICN